MRSRLIKARLPRLKKKSFGNVASREVQPKRQLAGEVITHGHFNAVHAIADHEISCAIYSLVTPASERGSIQGVATSRLLQIEIEIHLSGQRSFHRAPPLMFNRGISGCAIW